MLNHQAARRRICAGLLAVCVWSLPALAQGPRTETILSPQARSSVLTFEKTLSNTVVNSFGPLSLLGKVKGAFVPGYGYMFTFLVNMGWGMINSPMGNLPSGVQTTPEQRRRQIEDMKDKLAALLIAQGVTMPMLERDKYITVIAFLEETTPERTVNKTVIVSVLKGDLDELGRKPERYNELKQRMKISEDENR